LVNIVGRPVTNQLQVLTRLRRNRGLAYVADFLLARAADRVEMWLRRQELQQAVRAFPGVTPRLRQGIRSRHPHLDCADPHAPEALDFVRAQAPTTSCWLARRSCARASTTSPATPRSTGTWGCCRTSADPTA